MNHKRGRPKARRAGCLMCKPNKLGQGMEHESTGQGARKEAITAKDVDDYHAELDELFREATARMGW